MADFVFLHGGGQGSWIWGETVAAISQQSGGSARCLALDVPGCGTKRGRDTGDMGLDAIIGELAADIAAAGFDQPLIVGHSQAGQILPRLELAMPGAFARHVYISCIAQANGHTIGDMMASQIEQDPKGSLARVFADPDCTARERFRVMFVNDMSRPEQELFLDKLEKDAWPPIAYSHAEWTYDHLAAVPCTYVLCLKDQVLTPHWQHIFAERFRCDEIVHIDAAHQVQNTRPHALAEVLLALASRESGAAE
ncbi:MAG: alpha/beta hydrolase [Alphaproteobacteria bacterium]|nr:alpha/beta hydrolase [Alphaproteobacteria bacterium]